MDSSVKGQGGGGRQFHFVRRIGTGGFGEVYLAEMSTASGFTKMVAIKLLKDEVRGNEGVAERMRDEARLLGMLRHRTIVQADDLITLSGRVAVVMEYIPGCNFSTVIHPDLNDAPIPPRVCLAVIRHVANALDVAYHRPSQVTGKPLEVLHRDIKPGNIRITPDGEVKVLDFGIARSEGINREAHTTEYQLGSLNYMAPELLVGDGASPRTDVYSLGVTFYEAVARARFGWAGESEELHDSKVDSRLAVLDVTNYGDISDDLLALLKSVLSYDPAGRPEPATLVEQCRNLERDAPGAGIEEWANEVVGLLRDSEDGTTEDAGEFTGRILFEDDSSAMAVSLKGADFLEDETIAVPGAPLPEPVTVVRRRWRWQDLLILVLLLGVTGMVGVTQFMREAPDHDLGKRLNPKPPTPAAAEIAAEDDAAAAPSAEAEATPSAPAPEASPAQAAPVPAPVPAVTTRPRTPPPPPRPAAEPEPAEPVAVRLSSVPMGIPVLVDGVPRGTTPLSGVMLSPGRHTVTFVDGGRRISERVTVTEGASNFWKYSQSEGTVQ